MRISTTGRRVGKTVEAIRSIPIYATVYCASKEERERLTNVAAYMSRGDINFVVGEPDPKWVSVIDALMGRIK